MGCVVSCRVAPWRFSFLVLPTCRCSVWVLFWAPFSVYSGTSPTRLCVHCPWLRICGFCKIAPSETLRRLTYLFHILFGYWPKPICRSVGKMYTSRVLVLLYYTHSLYTPTYSCYSPSTLAAEKRCSKTRKIHYATLFQATHEVYTA